MNHKSNLHINIKSKMNHGGNFANKVTKNCVPGSFLYAVIVYFVRWWVVLVGGSWWLNVNLVVVCKSDKNLIFWAAKYIIFPIQGRTFRLCVSGVCIGRIYWLKSNSVWGHLSSDFVFHLRLSFIWSCLPIAVFFCLSLAYQVWV